MKKIFLIILIGIIAISSYKVIVFFSNDETVLNFKGVSKSVTIDDNGLNFTSSAVAETVAELIKEKNIELSEYDKIIPPLDTKIYTGANVEIQRAAKIKILVDGKKIEGHVLGKNVERALSESQVSLTRLDKTDPELDSIAHDDLVITVTRINIEEITKKEDIDFEIITETNSKMGWRENKIKEAGKKGVKEIKYRITYKNGKEISRVILEKNILEEALSQVEIQGTYMKLKKAGKGQATWYSYQGGMFAASTIIPKGSYAKVTNTANGKTIVVQINDYGPQGKGRIIDLDKVAFQKIATLGAGVIGVKVEEILN